MKLLNLLQSKRGVVMTEVLIGSAISAVIAAGMLTAIVTLQRSFRASAHHAKSQIEQARLVNYIARDLRRALRVDVDTFEGSKRITMKVPDYYTVNSVGQTVPRDPAIRNGGIDYGDPTAPVAISYYKSGPTIYRKVEGGPASGAGTTILASEVEDFVPDYSDDGKQIVGVSISFQPKFQLNPAHASGLRAGTTVYATTLLRNKRQP
jgi:type II secretory pathway component PulJ